MAAQIVLQIVLIFITAIFTCAETAVISVNDNRLDKLAAGDDKRAKRLKRLTDRPTRFIEAMHASVGFFAMLSAAAAAFGFSGYIYGDTDRYAVKLAAVAAVTLAAAVLTLVFGVTIPKKAVSREPEKLALRMSRLISIVCAVASPFVWIGDVTAGVVLRIMGIDPNAAEDTVTEEEILMMSDAGAEKGTIDEDENRIIKNVFAFDDLTADQICTHRTDVDVLWTEDEPAVWEETIHRTRHSVFPICGESVDNVIGVLDAKDYFRLDVKSRENIMSNAVREPYFVHENMKADRLFENMKQNGADHFAVVVDEYGGMTGIITVTDLVEQLVGDFADDADDIPSAKLEQLSENVWSVPGIMLLSEVCSELDIELPSDKYDTFGGYVIAGLGDLPKDGSKLSLDCDGLHIDILEVRHHRIELCRVEKTSMERAGLTESETE